MEGGRFNSTLEEATRNFQYRSSLSLTLTLASVVLLLLCWNGIRIVKRKRKGEGEQNMPGTEVFPGPPSWDPTGILGNGPDFLPIENTLNILLKWGQTYGDIFKFSGLGQTWVVLNSGPAIQTLCQSSDLGHLKKSPQLYDQMKPLITNTVTVCDGEFWKHQRKIMVKSQTYQNLKAFMPTLNGHGKAFVSKLENLFEDGEDHKIYELINSSFIKIISEMITGCGGNNLNDEYDRYHHNFQIWKKYTVYRVLHPWFLFRPLWKLWPLSREDDKAVDEMFEFARKRIREHKAKRAELETRRPVEGEHAPPIFRSVLDELVDGGVEEDQIVGEINGMIFGGHDGGAGTIHFFCFLMALNPEIQKECQKEVDELFEDPTCYNEKEGIAFNAVSSNLKLVERCISETLRMFPPAFFISRKLQSPLKIEYDGQDILLPPGTNAVISPFALHRKAEYFPEPDTFNPDRFLPEECARRHPYSFVPFSAGPRNCLGWKFGMIEMKTMAAYTLRNFFLRTTDRINDIPLLPYTTTTPAMDYTFQFSRRNESCKL